MRRSQLLGVAALTMILPGRSTAAVAPPTVREIDRTFVCPERGTDQAMVMTINEIWMERMLEVRPRLTSDEINGYRLVMLKSHHCTRSLQHLNG